MTSSSQSMTLAEMTEYKKYIIEIINRLHRENTLSLKETITSEGKMAFRLEFRAPEWFRELNEDTQGIAFNNLQQIMIDKVKNIDIDKELIEGSGECDCCEHTSKRAKC